jgi:SAM-dependent methyltransferase
MDSPYFNKAKIAQAVAEGKHREIIGGAWNEIGELQFSFMVDKGLRPEHTLLDIGCGSLRGGVHFVRYLNKGNYFGIDINPSLVDSGWKEIAEIGCLDRLPLENLRCSDCFNLAQFGQLFDFALAQSLFTHLTFNNIRRCLEEVSEVLVEDGVFFATFFNRPERAAAKDRLTHAPGGVETYDVSDPYHYSVGDFRHAICNLPFELQSVGEWNHPRGQQILAFHKQALSSALRPRDC